MLGWGVGDRKHIMVKHISILSKSLHDVYIQEIDHYKSMKIESSGMQRETALQEHNMII